MRKLRLDPTHTATILGIHDTNILALEKATDCTIAVRGEQVSLSGTDTAVRLATGVLKELQSFARNGMPTTEATVQQLVNVVRDEQQQQALPSKAEVIVARRGKAIRPQTAGQQRYVQAIDDNTIIFGIGPAGSGKTYLAVAKAVQALQRKEVQRIILTRPAVEAGEKLGFLPGTLNEKIDPYLRPLHDALREMVDPEMIPRMMESGIIEVAPLAYMRGRTLNDAFVILDEAQNTTPAQMKMFLTRLGFGSKIVVTGDASQVDLPRGQRSGLQVVRNILHDVPGIHFSMLGSQDVVRHHLVGKIVDAYDEWEETQ
ncbi:MAG: PhoH family protein [Corynebacterium sp.]|nr:PhoH family protein [Corynebacterium sp.]